MPKSRGATDRSLRVNEAAYRIVPRSRRVFMKEALACSLTLLAWLVASAVSAAEPTYDIPAILATTGSGSSLGAEEQKALQIAETVVNRDGGIHGREVRFVFLDDQSTPQLAVQLANQALDKHPTVLIGSSLVASCNAMASLVKN